MKSARYDRFLLIVGFTSPRACQSVHNKRFQQCVWWNHSPASRSGYWPAKVKQLRYLHAQAYSDMYLTNLAILAITNS